MPKVPTYDSFQVDAGAAPAQRFSYDGQVAVTPQQATIPGAQVAEFGRSMQNLGGALGDIAINVQKEANALRVDDAVNRAKEEAMRLTYDKDVGFTNQRGLSALERSSGKPLADEYGETLAEQMAKIRDSLGNDAQKQAFAMRANDMMTSFKSDAIRHESTQFREYALSVREGTIANRMNELALAYNNPQVIDESLTSIKAATYDMARMQGRSAEWAEAEARKMTSNALVVAVGAALDKNDVAYADALMKKHAKDMDANDLLRVGGMVTKEMDNTVGMSVATGVMRAASTRMVTKDDDRAFNILLNAESGGRQFGNDGQPLTSSKGATGIAQVMPETGPEAAKLAGLKWDEQRFKTDATYNQAIGKAYFEQQIKDFGGNLAMAYAAYNAGPGATRKAIKEAEKDGTDWLAKLPAETQNYVSKNIKAYSAGQGSYQKPTLNEVHNAIRENPLIAGNATRLKTALDEATRQYDVMEKDIKAREENSVAEAMRQLVANGGRYSELPPSVRTAIPPGKVDDVMNFGQRIAKGDDITNPAVYQKLATDRAYLTGLSDNQFFALRGELSQSDFQHFAKERGQLIQGKPGESFKDLNTEAINSTLNSRLSQLRIDPTPKDGSKDAARVGAIRMFVRNAILTRQQETGKKMADTEVISFVDDLFARNVTFSSLLGDYKTSMMNMTVGNIPSAVKKSIKADLASAGNTDPTDGQILEAYFKLTYATQRAGNK